MMIMLVERFGPNFATLLIVIGVETLVGERDVRNMPRANIISSLYLD